MSINKVNKIKYNVLRKMSIVMATVCVLSGCTIKSGDSDMDAVKNSEKPSITDDANNQNSAGEAVEDSSADSGAEQQEEIVIPEFIQKNIKDNANKWIKNYAATGSDGDSVIMSVDEIAAFNENLINNCDCLADLTKMPDTVHCEDVKNFLWNTSHPSLPKYDVDGAEITYDIFDTILANRNEAALSDGESKSVRYGIVVQRANLRTLPTDVAFFDNSYEKYYDRIQETELVCGSLVRVLHDSADGMFYYVQAYNYTGWVSVKDIAVTVDKSQWIEFADAESFAVVTKPLITVMNVKLDMGVRLPVEKTDKDGFYVKLPIRKDSGELAFESVFISCDSASYGYIPYTMNNFYIQAFKYEGAMYGWGGMYDSVDCSGFVNAVMRSFGFYLPRNVSQQKGNVGEIVNLNGIGGENVAAELMKINMPAAVYKPGHVMLYLGEIDGTYYIIHSPEGGKTVGEEVLDTYASNLVSVNVLCDVAENT